MKKGPLSNKEKEYIETFYKTTPVKDLSHRMDRSLSIVKKFIDKMPAEEPVKEEPPKVKQPSAASNLLARNEESGVVIMTEGSSMESDKNRKSSKPPGRYSKFIHKIKEE